MKNKMKKIFAGVGIGLAIGSSAMLTGCSSDITFNQADLDNVISNVNSYLENTQNNNSEYVRNTLNELIVNGMNNAVGTNNIAYNVEIEEYVDGLMRSKTTTTYKRNVGNDTIKVYYNTTGGEKNTNYIEATRKKVNNISYSYDVEEYKINSANEKSYEKKENVSDISPIILTDNFYADYVGVYSSLIANFHYESLVWDDFIKSTDGDVETYKCTAINPNVAGSSIVGNLVLQFKNKKITKIEILNTDFKSLNYGDYYGKITYIFDYENETINFDKTGFETNI